MAAEWYSLGEQESGPHSFQELARLVADGHLTESDFVRRAETQEWQRVDEVVGLLRAARRFDGEPTDEIAWERQPHSPAPRSWESFRPSLSPRERWLVLGSLCAVCLLLCVVGWHWMSLPERFPEQKSISIQFEHPPRLIQMKAPPPARPSIRDLPRLQAVSVPGLEEYSRVMCPTLSQDLCELVLVALNDDGFGQQLLLARRSNPHYAFDPPTPIASISTPYAKTHPTLSPDGLKLIYAEYAAPSRLMSTRRESRNHPFEQPVPFTIESEDSLGTVQDGPQFVDAKTVCFRIYDQITDQCQQLVAHRADDTRLVVRRPLVIMRPWQRFFYSSGLRRAYSIAPEGITLAARHPSTGEFVTPELLISNDMLGPEVGRYDGTFWLSPKEDVMFFCSPGSATDEASDHRLWMIQL